MVAARVAAEKLRQKEQVLTDEIEKFRVSFSVINEKVSYTYLNSGSVYNM